MSSLSEYACSRSATLPTGVLHAVRSNVIMPRNERGGKKLCGYRNAFAILKTLADPMLLSYRFYSGYA